ncbi:MAG: hypothetical protein K0S56_933 [Microvirga sp.]|jgi:hypothetical protein|nr:hypothetical protein [Microvirga sp.]
MVTCFFNRSAIMRAAVTYARTIIEGERERYLRRWSGAIRCGDRHPPMTLPTWRAAMSEALRYAWAEAKQARAAARDAPAVAAELASVELRILSIRAAERVARPERDMLAGLQARAAQLHAISRANVAHVI